LPIIDPGTTKFNFENRRFKEIATENFYLDVASTFQYPPNKQGARKIVWGFTINVMEIRNTALHNKGYGTRMMMHIIQQARGVFDVVYVDTVWSARMCSLLSKFSFYLSTEFGSPEEVICDFKFQPEENTKDCQLRFKRSKFAGMSFFIDLNEEKK
jgi:hypothetical protein